MTDQPATLPFDPKQMIQDVAEAVLHLATEGETNWAALDESEQTDFLNIASVAVEAHVAWLTKAGFVLVPPGTLPSPRSHEEAEAMGKIAVAYMQAHKRKNGLVSSVSPKLVIPRGSSRH